MPKKDQSNDPREGVANPHTQIEQDDPSSGGGHPQIGQAVFVATDARVGGGEVIGGDPNLLFVMKTHQNQMVDGWLFPTGGGEIRYVTSIRGGNPSQPGTWHHIAKHGRSG